MLPPTTMAPPVITAVGRRGVNRHGWDDEAEPYTWSAVKSTKCPDCPSCYVTAPLFTGNRKVLRDVSRALGRAARVELRSRLVEPPRRLLWAGRCRHQPPLYHRHSCPRQIECHRLTLAHWHQKRGLASMEPGGKLQNCLHTKSKLAPAAE